MSELNLEASKLNSIIRQFKPLLNKNPLSSLPSTLRRAYVSKLNTKRGSGPIASYLSSNIHSISQ